jgi:hypothetical protein
VGSSYKYMGLQGWKYPCHPSSSSYSSRFIDKFVIVGNPQTSW